MSGRADGNEDMSVVKTAINNGTHYPKTIDILMSVNILHQVVMFRDISWLDGCSGIYSVANNGGVPLSARSLTRLSDL